MAARAEAGPWLACPSGAGVAGDAGELLAATVAARPAAAITAAALFSVNPPRVASRPPRPDAVARAVGGAVAGMVEAAACVMAAELTNPPAVVTAPAPGGTLSRPMASAVPA